MVLSLTWQDFTCNRPRHTDSHITDIDILLDLSIAFSLDLANLERDQGSECTLLGTELLSNLSDNLTTHGHWNTSPPSLFLFHSLNALIEIGCIAHLNSGDRLIVMWVYTGLYLTLAIDPLTGPVYTSVGLSQTQSFQEWVLSQSGTR